MNASPQATPHKIYTLMYGSSTTNSHCRIMSLMWRVPCPRSLVMQRPRGHIEGVIAYVGVEIAHVLFGVSESGLESQALASITTTLRATPAPSLELPQPQDTGSGTHQPQCGHRFGIMLLHIRPVCWRALAYSGPARFVNSSHRPVRQGCH